MALLRLDDIWKSYGGKPFIRGVSLEFEEGECLCLLGPSGCGKTTLLRIIAGLEKPDRGEVVCDGKSLRGVPPHRRNFGMMFQEFALFPHRNVFDNVAFGLRLQPGSTREVGRRVAEMLALVGLTGLERRGVSELSGGERQRVALARSLAAGPRLLMLDEPLGSLDRNLRERLMLELRAILKGVSTIFVTHDQAEAFAMADRIAVMHDGVIEQVDTPERLYRHPQSEIVAHFLGLRNLLPGRVTPGGTLETPLGVLKWEGAPGSPGEEVTLLIRPDAAYVATAGETPTALVEGFVRQRLFRGSSYHLELEISSGAVLFFELPAEQPLPPPGAPVRLGLKRAWGQVLPGR